MTLLMVEYPRQSCSIVELLLCHVEHALCQWSHAALSEQNAYCRLAKATRNTYPSIELNSSVDRIFFFHVCVLLS